MCSSAFAHTPPALRAPRSFFEAPLPARASVDTTEGFWAKGNFTGFNPWASGAVNAPFDQRFYLIMNLAVGGTNGYFADGLGDGKPWSNTDAHAANQFWAGAPGWGPTWTAPLVIDSVTVWQAPEQGGDYAYRLML